MSRITGADAYGLMEAYNNVYAPQELTEEQVWEEVETWVNSLIEEGYDLSEYSWEDMYENYLSEAIGQPGSAGMVNWQDKNSGQLRSGYKSSSDGKLYKNYNDAKAAKNSRMGVLGIQQGLQRTFRAGGGDAAVAGTPTRPAQTPLAVMGQGATNLQRQQRPSAPAPATAPARPSAGAPAAPRPAATTPAATPAVKVTPAAAAPSTAATGFKLAQQGVNLAEPKKPSLKSDIDDIKKMGDASRQRQASMLNQSFDPFDYILEYLVAEGYADTNEAAISIMANMSEEWREGIVEGMFDFLPKSTTVIPGKYGKNTVLSKKGGVEGVSDKSKPGSFTPQKGGFDKMDAERYATQHSKQGTSSGTSGINLAGRREISGRVK
jgi:hypothetical protein